MLWNDLYALKLDFAETQVDKKLTFLFYSAMMYKWLVTTNQKVRRIRSDIYMG